MANIPDKPVILFDGICNLCNSSVRFVLKRDKNETFLFSSLQSDAAKKLLLHYKYKNNHLESMLLIEDGQILDKSRAALRICQILGFPWSLLSVLDKLPDQWRDEVYAFIANRRYRWFGKKDHCVFSMGTYENRFI